MLKITHSFIHPFGFRQKHLVTLPADPTVEDILGEYVDSRDAQPDPFVRTEFVQGQEKGDGARGRDFVFLLDQYVSTPLIRVKRDPDTFSTDPAFDDVTFSLLRQECVSIST